MSGLKIVVIGGGSVNWAPRVIKDMLLTKELSNAEYVLYDINKTNSDLTKAFLTKLAGEIGAKPKITSTTNRAKAFQGANYFVITISTGGLDAMAHDLKIPEKFGIYHTVGDTSGPGGWARLIRNFDVFVSLAEAMNTHAPGAMVLNYTNPMTTLTDILSRLCEGPVVGLCHGVFENLRFLKELYKLKSEDDFSVRYGGLNHFFWITEAKIDGKDVIDDLTKKLKKKSFTDLLAEIHKDEMGYSSNREVATELFRLTGVMPYLGDRHTCEFFPSYLTNKANIKKYKIVRTYIHERKRGLAKRTKTVQKMVTGKIPQDYFTRSRETAADIITAHWQGTPFVDVGNVPNVGQIANLPLGAIVEGPVRVDRNGFTPITVGELPEMVRAFIDPWTTVFGMGVDACFAGDKAMALQALRLDPMCSHLNTDQVIEMGEALLKAHKKFIRRLK